MPRVLHNPPADLIFQRCGQQPLPIPLIVFLGPFTQLVPGDHKLGTASSSDKFRDTGIREDFFEALCIVFLLNWAIIPRGYRFDGGGAA